jgi:hypothetical protein
MRLCNFELSFLLNRNVTNIWWTEFCHQKIILYKKPSVITIFVCGEIRTHIQLLARYICSPCLENNSRIFIKSLLHICYAPVIQLLKIYFIDNCTYKQNCAQINDCCIAFKIKLNITYTFITKGLNYFHLFVI